MTKAVDLLRGIGRSRWLDVGAAVIAAFSVVCIARLLPTRARKNDFAHYYVARQLLFDSPNPYTTSMAPMYAQFGFDSENTLPRCTDPPAMLWLFAPLESLTPLVAYGIWVGVEITSLVAILWLTRWLLRGRLSTRGWLFLCAGALASEAVYRDFYFSQIQLLLAALLLGAYAVQQRARYLTACLMVTAAGLLKLYPFILLPWFVWRSEGGEKGRLGRAVTVILVIAVCVWLTGWNLWVDFYRDALPVIADFGKRSLGSFGISSFAAKFGPGMQTVGSFIGLAFVGPGYWSCLRARGDRESEFCLLSVAMLLGGLVVWPHYLVFMIFPMAVAAVHIAAEPSLPRIVLYAVAALWLNEADTKTTTFLHQHPGLEALLNYQLLYAMLMLWSLFFLVMKRSWRAGAV